MPLQPPTPSLSPLDEKDLSSLSFLRILKVPKIIAQGHNFTWMCLEGGGTLAQIRLFQDLDRIASKETF